MPVEQPVCCNAAAPSVVSPAETLILIFSAQDIAADDNVTQQFVVDLGRRGGRQIARRADDQGVIDRAQDRQRGRRQFGREPLHLGAGRQAFHIAAVGVIGLVQIADLDFTADQVADVEVHAAAEVVAVGVLVEDRAVAVAALIERGLDEQGRVRTDRVFSLAGADIHRVVEQGLLHHAAGNTFPVLVAVDLVIVPPRNPDAVEFVGDLGVQRGEVELHALDGDAGGGRAARRGVVTIVDAGGHRRGRPEIHPAAQAGAILGRIFVGMVAVDVLGDPGIAGQAVSGPGGLEVHLRGDRIDLIAAGPAQSRRNRKAGGQGVDVVVVGRGNGHGRIDHEAAGMDSHGLIVGTGPVDDADVLAAVVVAAGEHVGLEITEFEVTRLERLGGRLGVPGESDRRGDERAGHQLPKETDSHRITPPQREANARVSVLTPPHSSIPLSVLIFGGRSRRLRITRSTGAARGRAADRRAAALPAGLRR